MEDKDKTFIACCNYIEKEAKHCLFSCTSPGCTAELTFVRDQIIIDLKSDEIHEEALRHSWDLTKLRKTDMHLEIAAKSLRFLETAESAEMANIHSITQRRNML